MSDHQWDTMRKASCESTMKPMKSILSWIYNSCEAQAIWPNSSLLMTSGNIKVLKRLNHMAGKPAMIANSNNVHQMAVDW